MSASLASVYSFAEPSEGFHPQLNSNITISPHFWSNDNCSLNLKYEFPPYIIIDRFQLQELVSEGRLALNEDSSPSSFGSHCRVTGERDLEQPLSKIENGVNVSVTIKGGPFTQEPPQTILVQLPMHLRYLHPNDHGSKVSVDVKAPLVYWSCLENIYYIGHSPVQSEFESIPIQESPPPRPNVQVHVPVGKSTDLVPVSILQLFIVWTVFLWVLWKIIRHLTSSKHNKKHDNRKVD